MHTYKAMVEQLDFHNLLINGCWGLDPGLARLVVLCGKLYNVYYIIFVFSLILNWNIIAY